ncbi:zinc-ribbon domain-containing protein [Candidatus Bathyarchaeota archaeon]|nr:zinc-ribbon domain-containing protein [Candidatus Bathyarchaeota archaeon]
MHISCCGIEGSLSCPATAICSGTVCCTSCGARIPQEAVFCSVCGVAQ